MATVAQPKYYDNFNDLPYEGVFEQMENGKWIRLDLDNENIIHDEKDKTFDRVDEPQSDEIPWVTTAVNLMGTREIRGSRSNSTIMQWAKNIGGWIKNYYKNDDIPWCGLFVDHLMRSNGIEVNIKNPLSARAWNAFGMKATPCPGAVMVFSRKGGGHVGLYVSEDKNYYHILGGNQSNSVNVTKVAKNRFLGARWPKEFASLYEKNNKRVYKTFDGKVSINEA